MTRTPFAPVAAVVLAAGLAGVAATDPPDPVLEALTRARAGYQGEIEKAKRAYLAKVDERTKKVADGGDLDALLRMRGDKDRFLADGTAPTAGLLKGPYVDYQEAVKAARRKMNNAYEAAVKEYTRKLDTAQAAAVRTEQAAFRAAQGQPGFELWPEVRAPISVDIEMVFCWIPAGAATLGAPAGEKGRTDSEPEHEFATTGFWLRKYEVTQLEYELLMGVNPSTFNGKNPTPVPGQDTSRFPVENVTWADCRAFVDKLNALPDAAKAFPRKGKFVLPHEDEWEYACRGGRGNKSPFAFGDELNGRQANSDGRLPYGTTEKGPYLGRTAAVGSYAKTFPHPWGLCDMHGNVSEYCETGQKPPKATPVIRGGGYASGGETCRSAYRDLPGSEMPHNNTLGFRVCFRPD